MCFIISNDLYTAHHNLLGICHQLKISHFYGTFNFLTQCICMRDRKLVCLRFSSFSWKGAPSTKENRAVASIKCSWWKFTSALDQAPGNDFLTRGSDKQTRKCPHFQAGVPQGCCSSADKGKKNLTSIAGIPALTPCLKPGARISCLEPWNYQYANLSWNTHPAERYLIYDIMILYWCQCKWQIHFCSFMRNITFRTCFLLSK